MYAQQGGAEYVDQETVIDGHFITARTWHDNAPMMRAFIKMLQETAPAGATNS